MMANMRQSDRLAGAMLAMGICILFSSGCAVRHAPAVGAERYRPVGVPSLPSPPALGGQISPVPATTNSSVREYTADTAGRVLKSGDRIKVTIHVPPEPLTGEHVVDEQGRINLPLIGPVRVTGRSCAEAQQLIEKRYVDEKYYKQVTVIIVPPESEFAVYGEVLRPGTFPLTRNLTLIQALSRAGRYTEYADPGRVFLTRDNERTEINLDDIRKRKAKDITIIPGDVIEVPRTWY